jgi:outer membrane lipoprotein-sorting protein
LIQRHERAIRTLCAAACLIGAALIASGAARWQSKGSWTLDRVLVQLDDAAKSFKGLSADVERTKVTVVVNDKSTENGTILVRGDKMLLEMKPPDARTILRSGDTLSVYTPGLKRVEEYNIGKNRALVDEFMQLGFGQSGKDLEKHYLVTLQAEADVDQKKAIELELTPKTESVRSQFSKILIWFDESSWLPVQQQLFETGSGDYETIHYTKIVRNPKTDESEFKPHWPKGTEKIHPQGQ